MLTAIFFSFLIVSVSAGNHDRKGYSSRGIPDYAIDEPYIRDELQPRTHIYPNLTQCVELCDVACTFSRVYMDRGPVDMYSCSKLKPPKVKTMKEHVVSMLGSIKSNTFYFTLLVIGIITLAIVLLLTLCFCCSYCCRQPVSSRGSSKDALNPVEDGEFRETLDVDFGAVRKERDFSRRGTRAIHNV